MILRSARLHTPETRTLEQPRGSEPISSRRSTFLPRCNSDPRINLCVQSAFAACEAAIVILLFAELRRAGARGQWVLLYAWNPLLVTCVAQSGHVDILGVLLLLLSVAALQRRWRTFAAVAFGLAVAVKFLPIVLMPLYWRRVRVRDGLLAVLIVGLLYVPFLHRGSSLTGSLGMFVQRFRFNDPVFATLVRIASPQVVASLAVLAGLAISVWLRRRRDEYSPDTFAWPMAASLLCAPVVYPWYLLWLLPFAQSVSTVPLIIWTVSIIPTFYVWHLRALGGQWHVPVWIMLLEFGSVAAGGAIIVFRRFTRPAVAQCSSE